MPKKKEKSKLKAMVDVEDFFTMVCSGIRAEYEQGASVRKHSVDIKTLYELLAKI